MKPKEQDRRENKEDIISNMSIEELREYIRKGSTSLSLSELGNIIYLDMNFLNLEYVMTPRVHLYKVNYGAITSKGFQSENYLLHSTFTSPNPFEDNKVLLLNLAKGYKLTHLFHITQIQYTLTSKTKAYQFCVSGFNSNI
jgi:hypothetical protein